MIFPILAAVAVALGVNAFLEERVAADATGDAPKKKAKPRKLSLAEAHANGVKEAQDKSAADAKAKSDRDAEIDKLALKKIADAKAIAE